MKVTQKQVSTALIKDRPDLKTIINMNLPVKQYLVRVEVVEEGLLVLCSMLASSLLLFSHLEQS